jgi:hypothetical protein
MSELPGSLESRYLQQTGNVFPICTEGLHNNKCCSYLSGKGGRENSNYTSLYYTVVKFMEKDMCTKFHSENNRITTSLEDGSLQNGGILHAIPVRLEHLYQTETTKFEVWREEFLNATQSPNTSTSIFTPRVELHLPPKAP